MSSNAARELARKRWDTPEAVQARYERLERHIQKTLATLPPLDQGQIHRLTMLIRAQSEVGES